MKKLGWRATVIINDLQKEEVSKGVHTYSIPEKSGGVFDQEKGLIKEPRL